LHGIDVAAAAPVEFVLDHVEKAAMQPLDERQGLEIGAPDLGEPVGARLRGLAFQGTHRKINLVSCVRRHAYRRVHAIKLRATNENQFKQHTESKLYMIQ